MECVAIYHNGRMIGYVQWSGKDGEEPVNWDRYDAGRYLSRTVTA